VAVRRVGRALIRDSRLEFEGPEERMYKAKAILAALGGVDNIIEIEPCTTRLRTVVHDALKVSESALKLAGVHRVMCAGTVVQVMVGPDADTVCTDIEDVFRTLGHRRKA
jgi:PTS system N-acetylglucosamine-specific IIB component